MKILITAISILFLAASLSICAGIEGMSNDFADRDGLKIIRTITPGEGYAAISGSHRTPIRNPHLMAQVIWVDRNHEFAIPENVSITPDGASIFAGWWLNNMRYAHYASAGLEAPVWRYNLETAWTMPVDASNTNFAGTGSGLPAFIWGKESPLNIGQIDFDFGYNGGGVSFSGDGNLLAAVGASGQDDAVLVVYDMVAQDTVFIRHFVPIQGLYGADISADGSTVVVSCYGQLYVYNVPAGDLIGQLYNYSQGIARLSGNGSLVTTGTFTGQVYLYEWDGSEYSSRWIRTTGHDWVTTVDISDDGSTVACGTLDFSGGSIAGGKLMEWDGTSGEVLLDYTEYGDEVSSVALSSTGEYVIAGSWGKYNDTYGDVVTCFYRGIDVPIFQLLDDIDEPGSIFSVAISESGHYAAAGGKAVHAREFGNGGMLYSIMIREPLANDVAVASIDDPGEFGAPGVPITPTASFINVGSSPASFQARCSITNLENGQEIYTSSFDIPYLTPFFSSQVFFSPDFVMPSDGRYLMEFEAIMDGDQDTANNYLSLVLRSWHDMKAQTVTGPFNEATLNWGLVPSAEFKNLGSYTETVDIIVAIYDSLNTEVYSALNTIFDLPPYSVEEVQFDPWTPEAIGNYRVVFTAEMLDDLYPLDNSIEKTFMVVEEMMYDDGVSDAAYWVDSYPSSSNRKFGQRFELNLAPPANIVNVRFYQPNVSYAGSFDYLGVAKELEGLPDTSEFIVRLEEPSLPGPENWASFDFDTPIDGSSPLWFILHWLDTDAVGPYVGSDNTGTFQRQSYWYSDNTGNWTQWNFSDWMMRMTLRQSTGLESEYYAGLPRRISLQQNYPNPFNPSTTIKFGLPDAAVVKLEIFNNLGQRVRMFSEKYYDAGYHSLIWDGNSDTGLSLSSGIYYYRLTSGDFRISQKMTLIK